MSWIAGSLLVLLVTLAVGFAWYERTHPTARTLALIATLAGLAALGRIAFAPLPNVKPMTDIVLIAGYALGGAPGFMVGAVSALASNVFFGQGPWTPWQMAGWGLVGLSGAGLAAVTRRRLGRVGLALWCGVAGLLYGTIMNLHLWVTYSGDHTLSKLYAYAATSFGFDMAHAVGNVLFCLAFGPALVAALRRFRERFEVEWRPLAAAGSAAAALLLVAAAPPPSAEAAAPSSTVRYLLSAQNRDGGFGRDRGLPSDEMYTGWSALALMSAGKSAELRRATAYIERNTRRITDVGELQRTILVARRRSRRFGGRDLVASLLRLRRDDGSWHGRVNTTAFSLLALRAAGFSTRHRAIRRGAAWLRARQNRDGGFNFAGRGASGIDDTGAAVQGLVAAGGRGSRAVSRAGAFLASRQNTDGGYGLFPGQRSNAQSTSWAIQGLVAAGRDPDRVRRGRSRTPMQFLVSLVERGGAVRYSRTSRQTPVWVTAQAITALQKRALPL